MDVIYRPLEMFIATDFPITEVIPRLSLADHTIRKIPFAGRHSVQIF